MPVYIGDYLRDTRRLNAMQHGAYLLLLMEYWTAKSLPTGDKELARIACMTPAEWRKNRKIIQFFFEISDEKNAEWRHPRLDKEIAKADEKIAKTKAAADQRWDNQRMQTHTDSPLPSPSPSHKESMTLRRSRRMIDSDFEVWFAAYPERDGLNLKDPARKKYRELCEAGATADQLTIGLRHFIELEAKNIGTRMIKTAGKFLNDWSPEDDNDYEPAPVAITDREARYTGDSKRRPTTAMEVRRAVAA
jgi:uncharacterized protein YdaU (DUF1376 family)